MYKENLTNTDIHCKDAKAEERNAFTKIALCRLHYEKLITQDFLKLSLCSLCLCGKFLIL